VSPITPEAAAVIAQRWLDAFNAHRADQVVEHVADDVTARSPVIARLRPESGGYLEGKSAVLSYYEDGLPGPELHFTLVEVLTGIGQLTILYRNRRDVLVAESLSIREDGLISAVSVTYGPERTAPADRATATALTG
jgi:hypothetical protein